eukprot:TRINITY_DN4309_c0_g1_i1.p1 TRINITY_DN4309_c0_g1~~TRINITY_DN4309_c0_g1_i1.p1  ORF type:complete len:457 (+),score=90.69 TRINITY_DN4309_c0_g1_i1:110-1480(+)
MFGRISRVRKQYLNRKKALTIGFRFNFMGGKNIHVLKPNINFKLLKERKEEMVINVKNRNMDVDVNNVISVYDQYVVALQKLENLRSQKNQIANSVKKASKEERPELLQQGKLVKQSLKTITDNTKILYDELVELGMDLPNFTHPDAPIGGEGDARVVFTSGSKTEFDFEPKTHEELGRDLDLFDFDAGVTVSGTKFYFSKNEATFLELALINWVMKEISQFNYTPTLTPDIALSHVAKGCGFNPRLDSNHIYSIEDSNLCLIGTSEVPLAGQYHNLETERSKLPMKSVGYSHCFRAETNVSKMSRGLYRVHQFSKVEMFILCQAEDSEDLLNEILDIEVKILQKLGLHFKVLDMPTQELGNPAYRKFDIEAYIPSIGFGEVTSCSNCTDYQARRLNIRLKEKGPHSYLHTLNGTGLAIPRIIMAILENNQQEDGSVNIPQVLHPYLGFTKIVPKH